MTAAPAPILTGPLDTGLTVLEASAGTGKTFALAALATRWVAERGVKASELCIVSFTEAATAELRGRVRTRLAEAAAHLAAGCPPSTDEVLVAIADGSAQVRSERLANLERALADFDAATISTIHGFCARVVSAGGGGGGELPITDDNTDVRELVHDTYLARFGGGQGWAAEAHRVIQAVELRLKMPDAVMWTLDRTPAGSDEPANYLGAVGKLLPASQVERAAAVDDTAALVDELVAIAPPGHRWDGLARVRAKDFVDEPLVVYERNSHTFRIIERFLLEDGVFARFAMEINDLEAVKRMVEAGLGVAVMATWMVRDEVRRGSLTTRPVGARGLHRAWGLLQRANESLTASQKGFASICRTRFPELVTSDTPA